jgi:hypothetical protein
VLRNSGYTHQNGGGAKLQASISHSRYLEISFILAEDTVAAKILHKNDEPGTGQTDCRLFYLARPGKKCQALNPGLFCEANQTGRSGTDVELSQATLPHYDGVKSVILNPLENLPLPQWEAPTTSHDSTRARSSIPPQHIFET